MSDDVDLLVIGGGINGVGIARDAAGRGLRVLLVERDDLGAHTSSASTKLIHGGLRYLEHFRFGLVRESLAERELLLTLAPHLIRPMRFVMPLASGMRPAWLIRAGLFLYDRLGGRSTLARSGAVALTGTPWGAGLKPIDRGFVYSDGWVDDARLVVANALGAAEKGADIRTRTAFVGATRDAGGWRVTLGDGRRIAARAIVNAAGPWVGQILGEFAGSARQRPPRLVKGSHIIVPRLAPGDHGFILQNHDRRVIFAIPYEHDFTLVGTTDQSFTGDPSAPSIDGAEVDYLCACINRHFVRQIGPGDVVSSYSGVRPLYDDGRDKDSEVTRDYVLALGYADAPQLLSVFGGKITTYRRLAERALDRLARFLPPMGPRWTATARLPGGDLPGADVAAAIAEARRRWPLLAPAAVERMVGAYGSRLERVLAGDGVAGRDLGEGLLTAEVDYLVRDEWARTSDDILLRRTKLGLHGGPALRAALDAYLDARGEVA